MQMVGEQLGLSDQFLGVDELTLQEDGSLKILERIEDGEYQVLLLRPPCGGGMGNREPSQPPNNPQIGMVNMRSIMPALQKAQPAPMGAEGVTYLGVELPAQRRETRIVKDLSVEEIAREIVAWIKQTG